MRNYWKNIKLFENLTNIKWNALRISDDTYIKTKTWPYGDKAYNTFPGLNVPEDDVEYKYFAGISIDSLLLYKKYYI